MNKLCQTLLALIFISSATLQTFAAEKLGTPDTPPTNARPSTNAPPSTPLSIQECNEKDGHLSKVSTVQCPTGEACDYKDGKGNTHTVCLTRQ